VVLAVITTQAASYATAADLTTADITVSVAFPAPAAGTVEIGSISGPSRRWTAALAADRRHTFRGLPPGRYLVRVVSSGGATETEVTVRAGDRVVLELTQAASSAPRIEFLYRDRPGLGQEFSRDELKSLPSGESLWGLVDTAAPFVIADRFDAGGLATGGWPRVGMRGASWTSTRLLVGDVEMAGPNPRGSVPFYPDLAALDGVTVFSGLASLSVGTSGAAVALVPARPGATRQFSVGGSFIGPRFVADQPVGVAPVIGQLHDAASGSLQWSGPVKRRVGAVVSGSVLHANARERDRAARGTSQVSSLLAHVVASPTDRDEVRLLAVAQGTRHPFEGASPLADPIVSQRNRLFGAHLTWERNAGGAHRLITVGVQRGTFTPDGSAAAGGTVDRATYGPVPTAASRDISRVFHARAVFAPTVRRVAARDHGVQLSLGFRREDASASTLGSSVFAEQVFGVPARVWMSTPQPAASSRHITTITATANDDIALSRTLTLTLGLRADFASGRASGASASIGWSSVAPLAVVQWRPRLFTMSAGYRRYARQLSTDLLAFGDPGEPLVDVYRWNDRDGDGAFSGGEQGPLVARAGRAASVASIASDLRSSYTDEFSARAERHLGRSNYLRVTATVRYEDDLVRSVNTGAPASAYRAFSVPNEIDDPKRARDGLLTVYDRLPETFGQDFYELQNVPGEAARYRGLEIAWELRTARWFSTAGASAFASSGAGGHRGYRVTEADPGVIGELFENPNAASFIDNRSFFDRAYVMKWSTIYRGPKDVTFGVTARYQDGQPFARMVLVRNLAQGAEMVAADYSEATRFTFTGSIDARIGKTFTLAGRRATALVDIFNLSNLAEEVEENSVGGPTFRRSTAMQPRRTVRLGLQIDF
jgi:hypothetical protein